MSIIRTIGYRAGKGTMEIKVPEMPRRVISAALRVIKAEHRASEARRWAKNRVHIDVLAAWAISCQDSTHIGDCRGRKVWAEVNRDAATTWSEASGDGRPLNALTLCAHLEYLWHEGRLPLVLATDNALAYKDFQTVHLLRNCQVIHLLSRPHTPQDNSRAEYGIGEGKALAGLGKGVRLQNPAKGVRQLDQALDTLNNHWPRQTKDGLTAVQLTQKLPYWESFTRRSTFYDAASEAISAACRKPGCENTRLATREAIFRTLEQFGMILRTRGERKGP
jgi:transposase InsO family protein